MIRDGGSLVADFQGGNGAQYWLLYKLISRQLPTGQLERVAYSTPVVVERFIGTPISVSWEHAVVLLNQMRPLVRDDRSLKWLEAMIATADARGQLPAQVTRIL